MSEEPVAVAAAAEPTPTPAPAAAPAATPEAAKPAAPAAPAKSGPVSTVKPTSIISDAGKPAAAEPKSIIDGAKAPEAAEAAKPGDPAKPADPAAPVVPEKYEIKAPEGMTLDEATLEKFTPIAKELGLSNDQVQKLANFQAEQVKGAQEAQKAAFNSFVENAKRESTEFFGAKLADELPFVAKGRDMFADSEVMDLLEATGLSNHKSFIKMFAKMGRTVSEQPLVDGKSGVAKPEMSDGQILYQK